MGRKSTLRRLPDEQRTYIEARLAEGKLTLDELIADLRQRWPDAQTLPSRSAVHRYGQQLERRLSAIRASTEAARIIQSQVDDREDARSGALTAMIQSELFESIMALQEAADMDPAERVDLLSSAAKNIATLTRSSVNLKRYQAEAAEAARQALLAEQREKLKAMPAQAGVTPETMQAIRAALGITA